MKKTMKLRLFMKDKRDNSKNLLIRKIKISHRQVLSSLSQQAKREEDLTLMIEVLDQPSRWTSLRMILMTLTCKWTKMRMKKRNSKSSKCNNRCSNKWNSWNKHQIKRNNSSRYIMTMMMKMKWKERKATTMNLMKMILKCMKSSWQITSLNRIWQWWDIQPQEDHRFRWMMKKKEWMKMKILIVLILKTLIIINSIHRYSK